MQKSVREKQSNYPNMTTLMVNSDVSKSQWKCKVTKCGLVSLTVLLLLGLLIIFSGVYLWTLYEPHTLPFAFSQLIFCEHLYCLLLSSILSHLFQSLPLACFCSLSPPTLSPIPPIALILMWCQVAVNHTVVILLSSKERYEITLKVTAFCVFLMEHLLETPLLCFEPKLRNNTDGGLKLHLDSLLLQQMR